MGDSTCVEKMIKINNFLTFISRAFGSSLCLWMEKEWKWLVFIFFFASVSTLFTTSKERVAIECEENEERNLVLCKIFVLFTKAVVYNKESGNEMKWHPNIIFHNSFLLFLVYFMCYLTKIELLGCLSVC